jgi:hypothetical protein
MKIHVTRQLTAIELKQARQLRHAWNVGSNLSLKDECELLEKLDAILRTNIVTEYRAALLRELPGSVPVEMFRDDHDGKSNVCPRTDYSTARCPACDDLAIMDETAIAEKYFDVILDDSLALSFMDSREELDELLRAELDRLYLCLAPESTRNTA